MAAWPRLLTGARKLECEGYKWHRQVRKAPRMFGAAIGRASEKEGKGGGKPEQQRPLGQAASAVRISIRGLVVAARSCPASFTTLLYDFARSGLQLLIHGEGGIEIAPPPEGALYNGGSGGLGLGRGHFRGELPSSDTPPPSGPGPPQTPGGLGPRLRKPTPALECPHSCSAPFPAPFTAFQGSTQIEPLS